MGISLANQGEVVTQVEDNLWQSTPSGTLFWLVAPDLCQSSTGVYFRRSGLNVYGSDGTWFSSLDERETQRSKRPTAAVPAFNGKHTAIGCLTALLLFAVMLGLLSWI
jgi:hypothetical protein